MFFIPKLSAVLLNDIIDFFIVQVIATTHFLDASLVYGATGQTAGNLRSFRAGRMRAQITRDGRMFMPNVNTPTQSCNVATNTEVCYKSGMMEVSRK